MFWVTYSAYSRAVTPQVEDNLLKVLSDENGADWHDKGQFKLVWHEMYAAMVSYYVEKVKFYADKYMNSPAGMALKAFSNTRLLKVSVGPSRRLMTSTPSLPTLLQRIPLSLRYTSHHCHILI
jgi:hypothetical protein